MVRLALALLCAMSLLSAPLFAATSQVAPAKASAAPKNMRPYVLVILKTGPTPVAKGLLRDEMFKGHFANMERLAAEGKLAVAGPFMEKTDWRGLFILAVETVEEAKALVATDPVIRNGEMVAEYHRLYSTKSLMDVNALHKKAEATE